MELKLLDAKSLFASEASHMGKRLCSRSFSNLQASCCGGNAFLARGKHLYEMMLV